MRTYKWVEISPGDLRLTTWVGDSQVIYRATWNGAGWVVVRNVIGAGVSFVMSGGERHFGDVEALVDADALLGL